MQVTLVAIAKNEHLYINEWVEYYINLGFDHIYLYDNDNKDAPYIGKYIDEKYARKITIVNIRGLHKPYLQHTIYNSCYTLHRYHYDWFFFVDIDEFLVGIKNVKSFLSQQKFNAFKQIRIKWQLFGDDNIIERDVKQPVFGFFKQVINDNRISNQTKSFIRGRQSITINSCHFVKNIITCLPSGKICGFDMDINNYENETIFVNHYMTKTLSEFIKQKLNRGDAVWSKRSIDLDYFWRINKKTQDKLDYLKNMGLE